MFCIINLSAKVSFLIAANVSLLKNISPTISVSLKRFQCILMGYSLKWKWEEIFEPINFVK